MADLPKRELGRTGLRVTMLGYGAMELRGAPRARPTTEEQAEIILNAVLDAGINYIDTSIDYGVSEERIGRYISHRRSEYYLASKCGCLVGAPTAPVGQTSPHVFTRDNIIAGVEQSLQRMKTDYLDVVQFHISPSKQTLEENGAIDAVMDLKQSRKYDSSACRARCHISRTTLRWASSTSSRSPTQQWNASMKRLSRRHPLPGQGSSFAVEQRRVRHPRINRKACSGSDGNRPVSMTCVAT